MTRAALASSTFEVSIAPQAHKATVGDARSGRLALGKIVSGDLDALSKSRMLAVRTAVAGSAGYVAMGDVTAALHRIDRSLALQRRGTVARPR